MSINITILGQTISFILFVWFCMKYVWSPLISIIEKRQKKIADSLEDVRKSVIQSKKVNDEALVCLKNARIEAKRIVSYAHECQEKILEEAKHRAIQEYNLFLSNARIQIDREKEKVSNELRKNIAQFVVASVEKIIEQSVNEINHNNIVDNFIKKLSNEKGLND